MCYSNFEIYLLFNYRGSVLAVSSLRCGLLHISKESALIGDISRCDYPGSSIDKKEIIRSLGPMNKVHNSYFINILNFIFYFS